MCLLTSIRYMEKNDTFGKKNSVPADGGLESTCWYQSYKWKKTSKICLRKKQELSRRSRIKLLTSIICVTKKQSYNWKQTATHLTGHESTCWTPPILSARKLGGVRPTVLMALRFFFQFYFFDVCCMSHLGIRSHMNEAWHMYQWVILHIWIMMFIEWCPSHIWVTSHIRMNHVTYEWGV